MALEKNSFGITGNMLLMTMVLYSEVGDNSRCYRGKRMVMWHVNECRFVYKVTSTISLLCRRRCSNEGRFNVDIISDTLLVK